MQPTKCLCSTAKLAMVILLNSACEPQVEPPFKPTLSQENHPLPIKTNPDQPLDLSLPKYKDNNLEPLTRESGPETLSITKHLEKKHQSPFSFSGEVLIDTDKDALIDKIDGGKIDMEIKF